MKPKYDEKSKTVLYGYRQFHCKWKKTDDICKDIAGDVETRLQIMN